MVAFPQVKSPPVDTFTSFILANMTRFLCNSLQEAAESAEQCSDGALWCLRSARSRRRANWLAMREVGQRRCDALR